MMEPDSTCDNCRQLLQARPAECRVDRGSDHEEPGRHFLFLRSGEQINGTNQIESSLSQFLREKGLSTFRSPSAQNQIYRHDDIKLDVWTGSFRPDLTKSASTCQLCEVFRVSMEHSLLEMEHNGIHNNSEIFLPVLELKSKHDDAWLVQSADYDHWSSNYHHSLRMYILYPASHPASRPGSWVTHDADEVKLTRVELTDGDLKADLFRPHRATIRPSTAARLKGWIECCSGDTESLCHKRRHQSSTQQPQSTDLVAQLQASARETEGFRPSRRIVMATTQRPSRLLQICIDGVRPYLRLREVKDLPNYGVYTPYTTLSHCWGKEPIACRLTTTNIDAYCQKIWVSKLPQTFQDATQVTLALGYQYLWIDALCIIQDSPDDWQAEAPRMGHVYSNGEVNIAGSNSSSPNEGLFRQQNFMVPRVLAVKWFPQCPSFKIGFGNVPSSEQTSNSILSKRGWVFQEKLLSIRHIHFARDQILWDCGCNVEAEYEFEFDKNWKSGFDASNIHLLNHPSFISEDWHVIVRVYASTALTKPIDRLIALGGIAETVAGKLGSSTEDYLAGIWRHDIAWSLLWYRREDDSREGTAKVTVPDRSSISQQYIAPTWSWASIGRAANLDFVSRNHPLHGHSEIHPNFKVTNASVQYKNGNPFGTVLSGRLELKSLLINLDFREDSSIIVFESLQLTLAAAASPCSGKPQFNVWFDEFFEGKASDIKMCPVASINTYRSGWEMYALMLKSASETKGQYERVGRIEFQLDTDAEDGQRFWNLLVQGECKRAESEYLERYEDGSYRLEII